MASNGSGNGHPLLLSAAQRIDRAAFQVQQVNRARASSTLARISAGTAFHLPAQRQHRPQRSASPIDDRDFETQTPLVAATDHSPD
jgi:hypothetical protein